MEDNNINNNNEELDAIGNMSIKEINEMFSELIEIPDEDSIKLAVPCHTSCGRCGGYYNCVK